MPQRRAVSFESFFVHKGATCVRSDLCVWNVVVLKSVRNNWNWNNCWNIHLRFGAKQIIQWFLMILSCLIVFLTFGQPTPECYLSNGQAELKKVFALLGQCACLYRELRLYSPLRHNSKYFIVSVSRNILSHGQI